MSSVPGDHLTWRLLRSGLVHGYRQTARIMNTHLVTVIFFISSCRVGTTGSWKMVAW